MKYGKVRWNKKKEFESLLDVRRIVSGSKGVREIIYEAMKNWGGQEEFSAK